MRFCHFIYICMVYGGWTFGGTTLLFFFKFIITTFQKFFARLITVLSFGFFKKCPNRFFGKLEEIKKSSREVHDITQFSVHEKLYEEQNELPVVNTTLPQDQVHIAEYLPYYFLDKFLPIKESFIPHRLINCQQTKNAVIKAIIILHLLKNWFRHKTDNIINARLKDAVRLSLKDIGIAEPSIRDFLKNHKTKTAYMINGSCVTTQIFAPNSNATLHGSRTHKIVF